MNLFAGIALLLALCSSRIFGARGLQPPEPSKVSTIEGLRGYLAFFVFIGHSAVWRGYNLDGVWAAPPHTFLGALGEDSVVFFFMITAFLFGGKIIDSKDRPIKWAALLKSRVLRIVPMYAVVVGILLLIVALGTNWTLRQSVAELARSLGGWATFGAWGRFPDVNGFGQTQLIMAGVAWTLTYEWMFYLFLPIFAFALRRKLDPAAVMAVALGFLVLFLHHAQPRFVAPFLIGLAVAFLVRIPALRFLGAHPAASFIAAGCICAQAMFRTTAYEIVSLALLGTAFLLIVSGASLFGALNTRASQLFGAPTYSIYLLHGVFLYVVFRIVLGESASRQLSEVQHWAIVAGISPVLVALAHTTHRHIEMPFITLGRTKLSLPVAPSATPAL